MSEEEPSEPKPFARVLDWYSKNPLLGLLGSVASLVGVPLALVLFVASLRGRELAVHVNSARTTIVRSGHSTDLQVLYRGKAISTDVSGLQVAIWNSGDESIRAENILEAIVLRTNPKVPILEAHLRHVTRPLTAFAIDTTKALDGEILLSWRVLEKKDGAIAELIVMGGLSTTVTASGVVEGGHNLNFVDPARPKPPYHLLLSLVAGLGVFTASVLHSKIAKRWPIWLLRISVGVMALLMLDAFMGGWRMQKQPPFTFGEPPPIGTGSIGGP